MCAAASPAGMHYDRRPLLAIRVNARERKTPPKNTDKRQMVVRAAKRTFRQPAKVTLKLAMDRAYHNSRKLARLAAPDAMQTLIDIACTGMDCSGVALSYGRRLLADIRHRTETAMPQARCFKAMELALRAQALAEAR